MARMGPLRHLPIVDVERRGADRLVLVVDALACEVDTEDVPARRGQVGGPRLLLADAEEVVHVVQLPVLEEQGVPAEAGALGEHHALGVGTGDVDLGEHLPRPDVGVGRRVFRHLQRAGVVRVGAGLRHRDVVLASRSTVAIVAFSGGMCEL